MIRCVSLLPSTHRPTLSDVRSDSTPLSYHLSLPLCL
jgi:hypothetical protein